MITFALVRPCVGNGHERSREEKLNDEADQRVRQPAVALPVL